ncbi:MAG: type II toxin-antitoxin system antitoxin SocA domain-containing protein [Acetivibrionales bacterium]|jgi:uncharacterized phage-associated protein
MEVKTEDLSVMMQYCYECDDNVKVIIKEEKIETEIKGICFSYLGKVAYCEKCGSEVYIASINDENTEKANQNYRTAVGIIQVSEIQELLIKYNIGQKPLAKLLGWGESTIIRYLQGLTPSREYSNRLKELFNPIKMKELLDFNKNAITNIAFNKINKKIQENIDLVKGSNIKPIKVANYFLQKMEVDAGESITPLKVQKLVYYSQAWMLSMFDRIIFNEDFQAWQHGPVMPEMYVYFKNLGYNSNDSLPKVNSLNYIFDENEKLVLEFVWNVYGKYDGKYLEKITHSEEPWQIAWEDREEVDKGNSIITKESMRQYYKKLKNDLDIELDSISNLNKLYCSI